MNLRLRIFARGKDAPLHRLFEAGGFQFFECLQFVETAEEEEIGNLFDDFERVGNSSGPERVPDGVDLTADFAGEDEMGIF